MIQPPDSNHKSTPRGNETLGKSVHKHSRPKSMKYYSLMLALVAVTAAIVLAIILLAIAAGGSRTMGLKADGTVLAVGDFSNDYISDWTDIRVPEKQVQNVEYTSNLGDVAADLTIKSMTCRQEGDMLVFTIEYSACSAF